MRTHTTQPRGAERTTNVIVRRLGLSDPLRPQVIIRFTSGVLSDGVHNTWIEGDYVHAAGGARPGGRITIIDISNPADPQIVAGFCAGSRGDES